MPASPPTHKLHPFQTEALEALRLKNHVVLISPTGSGKSLVYQVFAAKLRARVLLIVPLVALAEQQASRLESFGFSVSLGPQPPQDRGRNGSVWIACPETFSHGGAPLSRALRWRPDLLVVDECHCIDDWGESFRPSYRLVPELFKQLKPTHSLWMTATLPKVSLEKITTCLPSDSHRVLDFFALPKDLSIYVAHVPMAQRLSALWTWLSLQKTSGIVFVATRELSRHLATQAHSRGFRQITFHAGFAREEKKIKLSQIETDSPQSIFGTSAFGMGLDYSGLRWAVLFQPPPSLLTLTQWIGRVGRKSGGRAHIWYDSGDLKSFHWMSGPPETKIRNLGEVHHFLTAGLCRRELIRRAFQPSAQNRGEHHQCGLCDFCLGNGSGTLKTDVS